MPTMEFNLHTPRHDAMVDITAEVSRFVAQTGVREGVAVIYTPHTTAAITINENADPDVVHDMIAQFNQMVPWRQPFFDHGEGNSAAHVKSSMIGASETVPVVDGRLTLGTWQGLYFCEFDGPRSRRVRVTVLGNPE
ncbi:MAG: YjbQ family protein [Phycisphaerae bacterium]|nr:YjbQ family protein [Phycisphaerae bacterium]